MSKLVFLQEVPNSINESYLFKIGVKKPKTLLCEIKDNIFIHKVIRDDFSKYEGDEDTVRDCVFDEIKSHKWIESDIFGNITEKVYQCKNISIDSKKIYFEKIGIGSNLEFYKDPASLSADKKNVNGILINDELTNKKKAEALFKILAERDSDKKENELFRSNAYADFYDKVISIIDKLDDEIYWKCVDKLCLPTLNF